MTRRLPAIVAAIMTAFAAALAAPDENALALFNAGAYDEAAAAAAHLGGPENLALAARALNARAYLEASEKPARNAAKKAFEYAEAAVDADPTLIEGHLEAAISLAQLGARTSLWKAFFLGFPMRARGHLDAALALDPGEPWALSTSGAWHLEVARRGAAGMYGADPETGYRQFAAARAAAPENIVIAYECALRLIAFDRATWRAEALAALDAARMNEPLNAFERSVQARAQTFASAVAAGREAERAFIDAQP